MELNLYYKDAGEWLPISAWANFFIGLGEELIKRSGECKRWTVALALPTKGYIAPIIGVGLLFSKFKESSPDAMLTEHLQILSSLEKNTPVLYRRNKRVLKAKFLGVVDFQGEQRLLIQTQSTKAGGLKEYISKKKALDIQINANQNTGLPKNQVGRVISSDSPLAEAVFGVHSKALLKQSETRICFVGEGKQFKYETTQSVFAVREDNQFIRGSLNDLLRIKQFLQSVDSYQSQFVSSSARRSEAGLSLNPDSVIIYSGSNSYLNWKEQFLHPNSVIILDRTDPQFEIAVEEINNEYLQSNRTSSYELDLGPIPGGIELLFWEEVK